MKEGPKANMDMEHANEQPAEVGTHPDPAIKGTWEPIQFKFNHLPVHMALLHTGKVLSLGGSANDRANLDKPFRAELWDPQSGQLKDVAQDLAGDIFCCGHTALPDGRLLVSGGTHGYDYKRFAFGNGILKDGIPLPPFRGMEQSYLFDPNTEKWTRVQDMLQGRWYPTLITLGDGRVVAMAGLSKHFPWFTQRTIEIYSPNQGWRKLENADRWLPLYPRLHLLPNGDVFYAGSFNSHYVYPFKLKDFPPAILNVPTGRWRTLRRPKEYQREEGTTILLPLLPAENHRARVLLVGGGRPAGTSALRACEIIDLEQQEPEWKPVPSMNHARYYAYPVILPNKQIYIFGGRGGEKGHPRMLMEGRPTEGLPPPHDAKAVLEPECFDPANNEWTRMAPMTCDRLYHANALLLPDGRVMMAGSNPSWRLNMAGFTELRIEIYRPPYLFRGPRPEIKEIPAKASFGKEFEIRTAQGNAIEEVALIRPTVTTHCVNTEQRYVGLEFRVAHSDMLLAKVPTNSNVLPPGKYMLFLVRDGIPSIGKFIHLQ